MANINVDLSRVPDDRKLKELILYIAKKSETDEFFGSTKLNKLLFFSDFIAFAELGKAITHQQYQKLKWGPALRRLLPIQSEMENSGECRIQSRLVGVHQQQRLIPLREPDMSRFSKAEMELIDKVIEQLSRHGATSLSAMSHRFIGWRVARSNEDIPYETALLSQRTLSEKEKRHAVDIASSVNE